MALENKVVVITGATSGIGEAVARDLSEAGASGVAAISAIWNAEDPVAALGRFREALGGL